jgi:hypothetical protein
LVLVLVEEGHPHQAHLMAGMAGIPISSVVPQPFCLLAAVKAGYLRGLAALVVARVLILAALVALVAQ